MKRVTFILLLAVVGCASMRPLDISKRTRLYAANYKTVFKAVMAYCQDRSIPVLTADKELGLINTDWVGNGGFLFKNRLKINFSLKDQGDTTKVVLTITTQQQRLNGIGADASVGAYEDSGMTESEATDLYAKVFDGIQKQI